MKGAVLIALVVVPQWRCPILKPLSAKLPPKSETAPHIGWQDGTILEPGNWPRKVCELILDSDSWSKELQDRTEDRTEDFLTPSGWFDDTSDDS